MPVTLKRHKKKWNSCDSCSLCKSRTNVVLHKGDTPCDVLFIGDAPGTSEDILGDPFVGPAGHLLDDLILEAKKLSGMKVSTGFTNLVACLPNNKEPTEEQIKACLPRLGEIINLSDSEIIVCVGKLSSKWIPKFFGYDHTKEFFEIAHPAALLSADVHIKNLMIKKCKLQLVDIFESLLPF